MLCSVTSGFFLLGKSWTATSRKPSHLPQPHCRLFKTACLEPFFEIQEEDVTPPRRVLLTTCMLQVSGFWFIIIAWHPEVSEESSPAMSINCTGRNQSCQKSGVEMGWSFVDRACFSALCGKGTNTSGEPRCSSVRKD